VIIRICSFTDRGRALSERIAELCSEHIVVLKDDRADINEWIRESFAYRIPFVFVGACGIAVRKISPFVKDKLTDCPVIVVDERGEYVIPILSGHMGGANELAAYLSDRISGTAVITTATDVENVFSIDVYAKEKGYRIYNREGIKKISSKLLKGERISWKTDLNSEESADVLAIAQKDFDSFVSKKNITTYSENKCNHRESDSEDFAEDIVLIKKPYVLGIGCKKNTCIDEIEKTVAEALTQLDIKIGEIGDYVFKIASIDLKRKEYGLNLFAQKNGIIYECYCADELNALEGDFTKSDFVNGITGTDNVCERAAVLAAGDGGTLVIRKLCGNGVTVALAKRSEDIGNE